MSKFEQMTEHWTPEKLADFMQYKYELMTTAQGNICTRAKELSHEPFYRSNYQHRALIGSLDLKPWSDILKVPPVQLVHPDPFELSQFRQSKTGGKCYRCWDSAVAIPACDLRTAGIHSLSKVPTLRGINEHWTTALKTSFGHIGPLGPGGKILRPSGPYILDLTAMGEFGWTIREAAHVLAHLRGDSKPEAAFIKDRNKTGWHNVTALTELAYGLLFDVPIDVTSKECGRPGEPDTYYGVELKSSSYIQSPIIRLPCDGRESPRVDETLAVMLFAVFIEPVPYGFLTKSIGHRPEDKWSGGPSMVAVVGWETIDYITHMPLGKFDRNPNSPVNYVIRGVDLLPPETHWAYLALAKRDRPTPNTGPGSRWRYVREWLQSDDYKTLRAQTPGLPCAACYLVNGDTAGAPERPKGEHPRTPKNKWPKAWREYYDEIDHCMMLGQKAVAAYEPVYYSKVDLPRLTPKARKSAHNKRLKALAKKASDVKLLNTAKAKMSGKRQGPLTKRQYARYEQFKLEQSSVRT